VHGKCSCLQSTVKLRTPDLFGNEIRYFPIDPARDLAQRRRVALDGKPGGQYDHFLPSALLLVIQDFDNSQIRTEVSGYLLAARSIKGRRAALLLLHRYFPLQFFQPIQHHVDLRCVGGL